MYCAVKEHFRFSKGVFVAAPTGIAAENVGGSTVNALFRIKYKQGETPFYTDYDESKGKNKLADTFLIIVDEISMISGERLDLMDRIARRAKQRQEIPFGGIKMVFVGDFCQLLPISNEHITIKCPNVLQNRGLAFESEVWHQMRPALYQLGGSQRHKDDMGYLELLNKVRFGKWDGNELEKRNICNHLNDVNRLTFGENVKLTRSFCDNMTVDKLNADEQKKLPGPEERYNGEYWWSIEGRPTKPKFYMPPERNNKELKLKVGSQVMLTRNLCVEEPYLVNGSRGEVVGFKTSEATLVDINAELALLAPPSSPSSPAQELDPALIKMRDVLFFQQEYLKDIIEQQTNDLWPVVKFHNDVIKVIPPINDEASKVSIINPFSVYYVFVPITLAWAMTIHKSQGLTIDALEVDFKKTFADNQVYTALSRVRRLDQLRVLNLEPHHITSSQAIRHFYDVEGDVPQLGESWIHQKGGLGKWWPTMFKKGESACCSCKQQSTVCERYATEDSLERLFKRLRSLKMTRENCTKYFQMLDDEMIDLDSLFGLIREHNRDRSRTIAALCDIFKNGDTRLPHGAAQKIVDVAFEMFPAARIEEAIAMPRQYRGGGKSSLSVSRSVIDLDKEEDEDEGGDGVYVLELEGTRFYVGKSSCTRQRILEHKSKRGAAFTKKHSVVNDRSPRLSTARSLTLAAERLETLQHMVRK